LRLACIVALKIRITGDTFDRTKPGMSDEVADFWRGTATVRARYASELRYLQVKSG
jgi:hypothetical protein